MNKFISIVGYVVLIMLFLLSLSVVCVATYQGMYTGTLLNQCKDKYNRPCELIAIPKEEK